MDKINEPQTVSNARGCLEQYQLLKAIARRQLKSKEKELAQRELETIDTAVANMNEPRYQAIIEEHYVQGKNPEAIYPKLGLSQRAFYKNQRLALVEFAIVYAGSDLLVWGD